MPWKVSGALDERMQFVVMHRSGLYSMTEICARFGISRQNGYKWLARYSAEGVEGLKDRSRAPRRSPQRMDPGMEALLIATRDARPHWGPKKIVAWLRRKRPDIASDLPAPSTVGDLFLRKNMIESRRRRRTRSFDPAGKLEAAEPNDVWTADFKGEFRLRTGPYCYPFTLADAHSRYLLACEAERSTSLKGVKDVMAGAFRRYGLPRAIRTDNGTPFVSNGSSGLTQLGVWWIKLGITHQRIPRARPDQNGRHERMHRTLKAEASRPAESSFEAQQERFDQFCFEFNHERPHEALNQDTPGSHYTPSAREFPEQIGPAEYPANFERRKVTGSGRIKFRNQNVFLAHPLAAEWLGLIEIDEDIWSIRFYDHEIGRLNPRTGEVATKVSPMSPV